MALRASRGKPRTVVRRLEDEPPAEERRKEKDHDLGRNSKQVAYRTQCQRSGVECRRSRSPTAPKRWLLGHMTCQITLGGKMHQNLTLLAVTPLGSSTARHPQERYFYRIIVLLFFYISAQCEHFHGRPEATLYVHSGHTYWIVCTCRRGEKEDVFRTGTLSELDYFSVSCIPFVFVTSYPYPDTLLLCHFGSLAKKFVFAIT